MKIKIHDTDGELVVSADGNRINGVIAVGVEASPGDRTVLHLILENAQVDLDMKDVTVGVREEDNTMAIAEFVSGLPAEAIEAAAMASLGMDDAGVVASVIQVIATLIAQTAGGSINEDPHECSDEGSGWAHDGSSFDLPPGLG